MKTAVVTDSTANLDQETIDKYGIKVVPIPYIIDGTECQDGVDLTRPEFYENAECKGLSDNIATASWWND